MSTYDLFAPEQLELFPDEKSPAGAGLPIDRCVDENVREMAAAYHVLKESEEIA